MSYVTFLKSNLKLIVIIILSLVLINLIQASYNRYNKNIKITFLDVGQGDAILIKDNNSKILIDGGPGRAVLRSLGIELGIFENTLDLVIATHADSDHIGGLLEVCKKYDITIFAFNGLDTDKDYMKSLISCLQSKNVKIVKMCEGVDVLLSGGAILKTLSPGCIIDSNIESNSGSIVTELFYGDHRALFMADAPIEVENHIISNYQSLLQKEITILKAGHHGSDTSSGESFIKHIKPVYTIISAGKDNSYGHPKQSVLEIVKKYGKYILSTALSGNISFESNGRNLDIHLDK